MIETAREMYIAFLHGIQKEDAEGVPPDKFKYWINKAQEEWMSERSKEFDSDQKRIDDLHPLRTERIIPTNGTRVIAAFATVAIANLKLIEGSSTSQGDGFLIVTEESYFNISGLSFDGLPANTGAINGTTGEVTDAIDTDEFYVKVTYAELGVGFPVVLKVIVAASGGTILITHSSVAHAASDHILWNTASGESIVTDGDIVTSFTDYRFLIPNDYPNPRYFRLLNVMFTITYMNNTLHDNGDISTWQRADIMRADERADLMQNAYRTPTDEKMYYRFVGDHYELINETDSTPLNSKMEYIKFPNEIIYYEPNSGNVDVDCELAPVQQKEITDMAVRMYIEATTNPRYQTQVVEDQARDKFE